MFSFFFSLFPCISLLQLGFYCTNNSTLFTDGDALRVVLDKGSDILNVEIELDYAIVVRTLRGR